MSEAGTTGVTARAPLDEAAEAAARAAEEEFRFLTIGGRGEKDRFVLGKSDSMAAIGQIVHKIAAAKTSTVLVLGESGTGKEMVANAIHYLSTGGTRHSPFVPLNCAAIPDTLLESELFGHEKGAFTDAREEKPGLIEAAEGGTLFLDEIGEMSLPLQSRILRVIETKQLRRLGGVTDRTVEVRIIAATNRDLRHLVREARFREDLFYRLDVVTVRLPPLRDRVEDIDDLARFFIQYYNRDMGKAVRGLTPEALALLRRHTWPGNVRELRNVIEAAILLEGDEWLLPEHLPRLHAETEERAESQIEARAEAYRPRTLREVEIEHIRATMAYTGGNKTRAAALLGISRQTLREKLQRADASDSSQG